MLRYCAARWSLAKSMACRFFDEASGGETRRTADTLSNLCHHVMSIVSALSDCVHRLSDNTKWARTVRNEFAAGASLEDVQRA